MDLTATEKSPKPADYDRFLQDVDGRLRTGASCAVALVDIDLMGRVNTKGGRVAGEQAIQALAATLQHQCADVATVYRYGGDAFTLLFDGTDKEQAFLRVEAARKAFAEAAPGVTISVGVAASPDDASDTAMLMRRCSEALYRAKVRGRNRVALAREEKMVTKTSHYTQGQLEGLSRLAKREGLNEATLLREALDDLLRKYNS
jgi:diguanylate cyclase (GGDEF)-like protein